MDNDDRSLPRHVTPKQQSGTLSHYKMQSAAVRSPFTKITAPIASSTPRKTNVTQRLPFSRGSSLNGAAMFNLTASMAQSAVPMGHFLHSDLTSGQTRHSSYLSAHFKTKDDDSNVCKAEDSDFHNFDQEPITNPDTYCYGSSHVLRRSLERETKRETERASPLHADIFRHESLQNKPSSHLASENALVHRVYAQADNHVEDSIHHRRNELASSRSIKAQSDYSRTSSVAALAGEQNADDFSAFLIKGVTDFRNASVALEERTKALQHKQEELNAVTAEKNLLSEQLRLVKERAKAGLESSAKRLEIMNTELQSLKTQSQDFFSFVQQAKASIPEVKELKETIKKYWDMLGNSTEDGIYSPTQGWKSILSELQTDLCNKQQLVDLFRDRLESSQGELAESRNRVLELERTQELNVDALQTATRQIGDQGMRITDLASTLRTQQEANTDILTENAVLRTKLEALLNDNSEFKRQLSEKGVEQGAFVSLQQELEQERRVLAERDQQIEAFHDFKDKLVETESLLKDRESMVRELKMRLATEDTVIEEMKKHIALAEAEHANEFSCKERLEVDFQACRTELQQERTLRAKLSNEADTLQAQQETLVAELHDVRKALDGCKSNLCQTEANYESLQERFQDQGMMLQLEKKSHGDIQERLLAVEAVHAETIVDMKRKAEAQASKMKEQIISLEAVLHGLQTEYESKTKEYAKEMSEIQASHSQHTRNAEHSLKAMSEEVQQLRKDLQRSKDGANSVQQKMESLESDCSALRTDLLEAKGSLQTHIEDLAKLRDENDHLRQTSEAQAKRALSIVVRYESGDLSSEEKRLIDTAHRASKVAHEQQLAMKGNEIRQRDNSIKALEKRKLELESMLARCLNTQAGSKVISSAADGGESLIDLRSLVSSQASDGSSVAQSTFICPGIARPATLEDTNSGPENGTDTEGGMTPAATSHSPPNAKPLTSSQTLSFAKLAGQTIDHDDVLHLFDDVPPIKTGVEKRKRARPAATAEEMQMARPLQRTRSAPRAKSKITGAEASTKNSANVPKVKARKRR